MEFFDFGTIFFLVAAIVIFFQLRNVLGRRTGSERPPFDPYSSPRNDARGDPAQQSENVVSLPRRKGAEAEAAYAAIDAVARLAEPLGGAAKASGAGGGDVVIAFLPDAGRRDAFLAMAVQAGLEVLTLAVAPHGVLLPAPSARGR